MKNLCILLKPASSLCNLRCRYCFYADVAQQREIPSFGVMSGETAEKILQNIRICLSPGDEVTFAFQGGEPTLAGLDFFRDFVSRTAAWEGIEVHFSLQTNGILLDEAWCTFLKKNRFLVGLSWDLLPEQHNAARVDAAGEGTNRAVQRTLDLLHRAGVEYNLLCTLTNPLARHPAEVWKQLKKYNIQYVQFTPCLDELHPMKENPYALTPERFAFFYNRLFDLWYADYRRGEYRSIKLFDDVVNLLAYGVPTACGMGGRCSPQIVVEADGSAYPCDFYCTDEYRLGSLRDESLQTVFESPNMAAFGSQRGTIPKLCAACQFHRFCGGGCKRQRPAVCCGPDDNFCGYQDFLKTHANDFAAIARGLRQ